MVGYEQALQDMAIVTQDLDWNLFMLELATLLLDPEPDCGRL